MQNIALLVLVFTSVVGCSLQDLRDLRKNAKALPAKAEQAAQKADTTIQIKREVDGVDIQLKTFTLMRLAPTDTERVALSRIFFRAFEFQKWTGQTSDVASVKNEFYRKAFYIFLPLVNGLIPKGRPLNSWWLSRDWRMLGVLAVSMDEVDPLQLEAQAATGVPAESMYSLIERGLTGREAGAAGYAPILREWWPEVIYLLQVRYNYLLALATERLTGVEFGYAEQLGFSSWAASDVRNLTFERITAAADLVDRAARTRALLREIGVEARLHRRIAGRSRRVWTALEPSVRSRVYPDGRPR